MDRIALLCTVVVAVGCAHPEVKKEVAHPVAAVKPAVTEAPPTLPAAAAAEKACGSDLDCGSRQLCLRAHCVEITADLPECSEVRVQFPFNSSDMANADRNALERSARCLKADRSLRLTIEGNADERGTDEYNMALGDSRAHAVEKYLEALGVSAAQLKTVSFGKERPLCSEHDEACWSKNRRAQLQPSRGR